MKWKASRQVEVIIENDVVAVVRSKAYPHLYSAIDKRSDREVLALNMKDKHPSLTFSSGIIREMMDLRVFADGGGYLLQLVETLTKETEDL